MNRLEPLTTALTTLQMFSIGLQRIIRNMCAKHRCNVSKSKVHSKPFGPFIPAIFNVVNMSTQDLSPAKKPKMQNEDKSKRFVWVDLEMSGLDIDKEYILEMACLITDTELNIVAEAPDLIIHQSDEVLEGMGEWCTQHHGESGLTESVRKSEISLQEAEDKMLSFIKEHTEERTALLAGNSIHADRMFLNKYMPKFLGHLHYRILDVSTIKELCRHWYPEEIKKAPHKKIAHRALDDIHESIEELKFYKGAIFK